MIRSMTGFGEVQRQTAIGTLNVQVRTVNHRHFHTHFRLPPSAERWETELTRILREEIARGHVHYRLEFQPGPDVVRPLEVDHGRVAAYIEALEEVKERHGLEGTVDLSLIVRLSDVFAGPADELERLSFDDVAAATREAVAAAIELREQEGAALSRDLLASLDEIETALAEIEIRAPQRLVEERDRLSRAVAELTEDVPTDEDRLAREIAYLAERWDINEEIVRLRSHVEQFRALVGSEDGEPAGKRLGFWVQEMHREANTIGSKSNDAEIARLAVDVKTAIEKLREQVENVE